MKSPSARDISEISDAVAGHHTPLVDAVLERAAATGEAPFHIPGHKRGTGVHPTFRKLMGTGLAHDLTEILGEHPAFQRRLTSSWHRAPTTRWSGHEHSLH